jgi:PAS domain S-box-containing protein
MSYDLTKSEGASFYNANSGSLPSDLPRMQIEEKLREQARLLDLSNNAIILRDYDARIFYWNKGAEEIYGFTRQEAMGKITHDLLQTIHPATIPEILALLYQNDRWEGELIHTRKDGSRITVWSRWSLDRDEEGRPSSILETNIDISHRKRVEGALRESEAWLSGQKEAFQAAVGEEPLKVSLGILIRTAIAQFGGEARAAFYLSNPDGTALHHCIGMPDGYAAAVDGFIIGPESLSCGLAVHKGEPVITPDVTEEPLWEPWLWLAREHDFRASWSFPVRTTGGPILGTLALYFRERREPTQRDFDLAAVLTHAATIIIVQNNELSRRAVAEEKLRAMAEAESKLRQAAEEANQLKDEFLAIMSHELRNPLNVILGYSELFLVNEEIKRSPQLLRMAEALKRNALTQSRLIRDLLDLSRLRSGKISLNMETVSLLTTIKNAVETVRSDAAGKEITIEVVAPGEPLFVQGDPVRLEQTIWNLLNNSVKFTPAGGKIEVRLAKEDDQVLLTEDDTGQGIDSSYLPLVFELCRQGDAGTSRIHSGMGIGLAVVHQLVLLHKGSIYAHSAGAGQGATFTIKLPLSVEPQSQPSTGIDLPASLDEFSILVVDDSEDTTEMLAQLLEMTGANVSRTTSAEDGLRIIAENEFDVVLSDISMPGMDGFEFLRRLRQLPAGRDVPVLALTGFGRPEDIQRAQAAGFNSHITKPFELDKLVDVIQQLPKR